MKWPIIAAMNPYFVLKWLLFPGINLHTRLRYVEIAKYFGSPIEHEGRYVLDAGCGNGMFSYGAYFRGNTVLGLSLKAREVEGCHRMFNRFLKIPEERLRFEHGSLYDYQAPEEFFDEIICTEVLEHLRRDDEVCRKFWRWLKPGGVLHVTAPNAAHPYNATFRLDLEERGGHVRPGYTPESFRALLEPIGFRIERWGALGGPVRQAFNRRIKELQARLGAAAGLPLFLLALPCLVFEDVRAERETPVSIYVRAVKR